MSSRKNLYRMVLAAMFLALCLVLPFLTGQIPQIGQALSPMHIPALLCGFFCGPWYGLAVGLIAPVLRSLLFGMPKLVPTAIAMSFELATYGLLCGLLYKLFPKKIPFIYVTLIISMIVGRVVNGCVNAIFAGINNTPYGLQAAYTATVVKTIPGIILHIILVPAIVIALRKYTAKD
ncbi:MAG: ECF transporter S component [Lachnospiraceae bacterium]|nr:ECF transporter S component [Lachnospiraceae bacterium]